MRLVRAVVGLLLVALALSGCASSQSYKQASAAPPPDPEKPSAIARYRAAWNPWGDEHPVCMAGIMIVTVPIGVAIYVAAWLATGGTGAA